MTLAYLEDVPMLLGLLLQILLHLLAVGAAEKEDHEDALPRHELDDVNKTG